MKFGLYDLHLLKSLTKTYSENSTRTNTTTLSEHPKAVKPTLIEKVKVAKMEDIECGPLVEFRVMRHAMVYIDNEAAEEELKSLELILPNKIRGWFTLE